MEIGSSRTGTFGAYGFVTADWKEKDLPLDLWLEWTLGLFDRVALSLYGDVSLPKGFERNPKLKLIRMEQPLITSFRFSTAGKAAAQEALGTDWKMALDVDEFLPKRLDTSRLNRKYAYPILYHHLYGNANTEIHEAFPTFPKYKFVIHAGKRAILSDGAHVGPPYFTKLGRRVLNRVMGTSLYNTYITPPPVYFELWHTGAARNPRALSEKWGLQKEREVRNGIPTDGELFRFLKDRFDFQLYKTIWKDSYLTHVPDESLPRIIRENKKRFLWVRSWK